MQKGRTEAVSQLLSGPRRLDAPRLPSIQGRELRISLAALHTAFAVSGRKVRRPGVVSNFRPCAVLLVILSLPTTESNLVGAPAAAEAPAGASSVAEGRVPDVANQDGGQEVSSAVTVD